MILVGLFLGVASGSAQPVESGALTTMKGDELYLSTVAAKGPTLVTFWALWCTPCKQELRALQKLYDRYSSRGFSVVAINQDSPKSIAKVRSYVASQGFTFPVVLDPNGQLLQKFNGQTLPYSVMLDSMATIATTSLGYLPGDEAKIEQTLLSILRDR